VGEGEQLIATIHQKALNTEFRSTITAINNPEESRVVAATLAHGFFA
jgi:hypothetical protein